MFTFTRDKIITPYGMKISLLLVVSLKFIYVFGVKNYTELGLKLYELLDASENGTFIDIKRQMKVYNNYLRRVQKEVFANTTKGKKLYNQLKSQFGPPQLNTNLMHFICLRKYQWEMEQIVEIEEQLCVTEELWDNITYVAENKAQYEIDFNDPATIAEMRKYNLTVDFPENATYITLSTRRPRPTKSNVLENSDNNVVIVEEVPLTEDFTEKLYNPAAYKYPKYTRVPREPTTPKDSYTYKTD